MIFVVLFFMGLTIAFLAAPIIQQLEFGYGRYGRVRDGALVLLSTLMTGLAFGTLLALVGVFADATVPGLVFGFIGALVAVAVLTVFSLRADAT